MPDIVEQTQAAYARRRGVTPKAIEKAIEAGRIPASAVRRVGRDKLINVAVADFALRNSRSRVNTGDDLGSPAAADHPPPAETAPTAAAAAETPKLTQARTETEQINAQLKQLELDERLGKVRDVEDVIRSMETCATALARDLDQLTARVDDLATAFTRNGVDGMRALVKQIVRDIRGTMSANMKIFEAGAAVDGDAETTLEDEAA